MRKNHPTPIQDQLTKNIIKGLLVTIAECMKSVRKAEEEIIEPRNNNYFVYKQNYEYIKKMLNALTRADIYELLSPEQKNELKDIVYEINILSNYFNLNIKHYNESEKHLKFFERANLKPFKDIVLKNISKEK
ncbi:MAG: hypothetical protein IJ638_04390 [Alphaproteobacteria bacterium]|nr:hypothetical protein [Alphaproteobacteria bacterium]